ncbi:hypothetical protein MHYP_G00315110 [Metynnis hypsauchen]
MDGLQHPSANLREKQLRKSLSCLTTDNNSICSVSQNSTDTSPLEPTVWDTPPKLCQSPTDVHKGLRVSSWFDVSRS